MSLRIAIFDDEAGLYEQWLDRLRQLENGVVVGLNEFSKEVTKLENRRRGAREKKRVETLLELGIESTFDDLDILIIDFDLLKATDLSGEEIAYLVRCYSKCGVIVALNRFGTRGFDLTLSGHPESFADLNVGSEFFDDPGLWSEEGWKKFRPWSWPILPELQAAFEQRVEDLKDRLQEPILSFLKLDTEHAGILPRITQEFIQGHRRDPEETTFDDFVTRAEHGLKRRDAQHPIEEMKPRIAASRIHHWLECFVLGGQEVLVDAPHLVMRFPSLLEGSLDRQEAWNRTAKILTVDGMKRDIIKDCEYLQPHWLSRPAWYWPKVRSVEAIPEVADPWSIEKHEWVFCEDTSRFSSRHEARSFVSELPSSFSRRYARKIEGIDYHPGVRFSL